MARNGSGTYSKVNTFTASTPITAAGHNANWDDLVAEMTNSVAADGQTTISGALKGASGTVSAPGYSFSADLDCGMYRIGANNIGVAVNGAKVLDIATTGLSVTGTITPSGVFVSTAGTNSAPGYSFTGDLNTGIYAIGADNLGITAGGTKIIDVATTGAAVTGTLSTTGALSPASLSGTISGTPTLSGNLTFSGAPTFSGNVAMGTGTWSGDATLSGALTFSSSSGITAKNTAKVLAFVTVTAGTPALTYGHNVTSVSDGGEGIYTLNLTNAFASASNIVAVVTPFNAGATRLFTWEVSAKSTTTLTVKIYLAGGPGDTGLDAYDCSFFLVAFGD